MNIVDKVINQATPNHIDEYGKEFLSFGQVRSMINDAIAMALKSGNHRTS